MTSVSTCRPSNARHEHRFIKWIQKMESITVYAERNDNDHECKTPISIPSAGVTISLPNCWPSVCGARRIDA